jgi:hypothetical protein
LVERSRRGVSNGESKETCIQTAFEMAIGIGHVCAKDDVVKEFEVYIIPI